MNEGSLPRGDLSNKKKKSAHRKARKKETKRNKKRSISQKRADRAQAKLAELADGLDKERIYAEGASEKGGDRKFKPGVWTRIFLREQEEKSKPVISYQDRILAKAAKKNELRPLPTDPAAIKALVTSRSFKPQPSKESLAKRYIPPGQE